MRVITGSARGRKLKAPEGSDVRPTSDLVKESIYSIIQFDVPGADVLDLFAGSGQLGIEALSRGANHCVFVDKAPSSVALVRENVMACGFNDKSRILTSDSCEYLLTAKKGFDIALLDPPYSMGLIEKAMERLPDKINDGGIVVCEHERELTLPDEFGTLKLHKRYKYGKIALTVYKKPSTEED
ncbi:MAG: 16S rRNA (guanine(966)-N(2))-methyltransferase RsmD [Ruminococcus sp.]|nr:16S rRNA (guanine(966)-N(2))-methyltransferase RsmD [Ruminococcus sp.]